MSRDVVAFHATTSQIALVGSILSVGFLGVNSAQAAIINHADINGLRTFKDVGTGLVWVDFDNFFNKSTSDMKTIVETAGFTFANKSSVQTLLNGLPLANPPTEWNSYASIMGRAPNRDLIWGSYDDGDTSNIVGWAFSFSTDNNWQILDNQTSINSILNQDSPQADMNIFAYQTQSSTAVPEPFTIVGTLIGGTAAVRMRKKLANSNKA